MAARTVCSDLQISSLERYPLLFTGTILLHLYAAALAKRNIHPAIPALYIPVPSPFTALEAFIFHAARVYDLSIFTCTPPRFVETSTGFGDGSTDGAENMREALELYRARFPTVEAILIGTRRTDPHGGAPSITRYDSRFYLQVSSDIGLPREDRS
jgi:FAD synthetase